MIQLFNHQSNLIIANDIRQAAENLELLIKSAGESQNITIHDYRSNFLDIETLRNAKTTSEIKSNTKQVYIFSFNYIKEETQNAMLKMLEEPAENIYIYIIINSKNLLLKTLLSRLFMLDIGLKSEASIEKNNQIKSNAIVFLKTDMLDRMKLEFVEEALTLKDDEDRSDKSKAIILMNDILAEIIKLKSTGLIKISSEDVDRLASLCSMADTVGFSIKAAIEYYSLIIPKVSMKL